MPKIQKTDKNMLLTIQDNKNSHSLLIGMQNDTATMEGSLKFLIKIDVLLSIDPAVTLPHIYSNEWKIGITKSCT